MTTADICQIIIGIVSIITSFGLSLFIYIRQVVLERKLKQQEIEKSVTAFIIENKSEMELLPLCIISNSIHKTDIHNTKIYTNYNKCSKDVQIAILQHEDVKNFKITQHWIDFYIGQFVSITEKYNLGKNMLYEGAKYFHRSYSKYQYETIKDIDPYVFIDPVPQFKKNSPICLYRYIDLYLGYKINPSNNPLNKVKSKYFDPPMDMLYNNFDFGYGDEKILCFWLMRFIISTCDVLCQHEIVNFISNQEMPYLEEFNLKTYEDMYYYTIYILHKTFYKNIDKK